MADPQAVTRMAQAEPQPPPPPGAPPSPASPGPSGGGIESLVGKLDEVGQFLKSQGPGGQKAMAAFQALLQELGQLGQDGPEQGPDMDAPAGPPGAVHESRRPGVQVL